MGRGLLTSVFLGGGKFCSKLPNPLFDSTTRQIMDANRGICLCYDENEIGWGHVRLGVV